MKGKIISFIACAFCAFSALAAVRTQNSPARVTSSSNIRTNQNVITRTATNTRTPTNRGTNARIGATRVARAGRVASIARGAITAAAASSRPTRTATNRATTARATTTATVPTTTFDEKYHNCYSAYFSCMDQFCAMADESHRRCICSAKINSVLARENALTQASNQLQDFKNLNINAILQTPSEVKAMLSASDGETKLAGTKDNSSSMKKLTAIGDVLKNAKSNSLSTAGTLDIAGDITQAWSTTELVSGADIANLTGESLYNAVHAQCADIVSAVCPSTSALNMVVSAYGMYIENDCAAVLANLDKQATNANSAVRETNREMTAARLENYNSHNSTAINECIANVRTALTADTACGKNYVHCLDITGLYLDRATGEPIYSENFYKLNDEISLADDILTNQTNAKLVRELNAKKEFAKKSLETCRDIADTVWDEYLRQAITEIYQGQQSRIQQVKNECMDVVNQCYDTQASQLRDYSNIEEQMLLGNRLELSEELCSEKLTTCSNLYGGGPTGLQLLVTEMHKIVSQKIGQNCLNTLRDYAKKLCRVPNNDTTHDYPYGCRVYAPGDVIYADNPNCTYINLVTYDGEQIRPIDTLINIVNGQQLTQDELNGYMCWENRNYQTCKVNFYPWSINGKTKCLSCPTTGGWICDGQHQPYKDDANCGPDYVGSLYQKMVIYAMQYCVRPSESDSQHSIPIDILADVNTLMDSVRYDMATVLANECTDMGGVWVPNTDDTSNKFQDFYNETNANEQWGLCREP